MGGRTTRHSTVPPTRSLRLLLKEESARKGGADFVKGDCTLW